jgi:hypothetical protein
MALNCAEIHVYILLGSDGWVQLVEVLDLHQRLPLAGIRYWEAVTIYGPPGCSQYRLISTSDLPRKSLSRTLLSIVHDPKFEVSFRCEKVLDDALDALKRRLTACITEDDDILTQFHSAEEINKRVRDASSHDEVVHALEWASSDEYQYPNKPK